MRLVVSGGGTGGHFFPALEVLRSAKERKLNLLYVGAQRGIEKKLESQIPSEKLFLEIYPYRGVSVKYKLRALLSYVRGFMELRRVVGGDFRSLIFGGYASVPVGVLTLFKRRALFLHEQNSVPSMTNRSFYPFARSVFITFEYTRRFFRGEHVVKTGVPVRRELLEFSMEKGNAKEALGFESKSPLVLFMGGSQGARFLNTLGIDFARKTGVQVLILSGEQDYERTLELSTKLEKVKVFPFRTDMGLIYSASDVAVCRAGAGTVTELSLFKVPAVFIPFPHAAGDHQYYNAKEIEDLGGGFVVRQEEVNLEKLIAFVDRVFANLKRMRNSIGAFANPKATELILDQVLKD
ncbi:UDP-N-acetylglucosamine-N-acetylmuramylpentapeptide N-acetylglucosamine transferase [Hydrogenivirga caldilitoris]|uniref:UDP-N-acetylglucosamine--N-acetylmuramyl-(pentapeptide) pyrophosphoryl-undecaprenol N-acetylglucosamine transferase n=1 Tax=Hydrogenivirga caldilitoris TaxID=246264 RepID=A0A497XPR8_9AQUI|nr:undecaprenyldiphospho-muramoylpentapeptide beta-N-acetylglucosaminyltransferase [Hydrogenivirga caldilitoris]RLJ70967.1 UDP-N-acetylglucosamine-N-acetylmuramylpentapeptide N-acetylglucosamine transferase [Hydrogenivirga caldilitoris]